MQKQMQ